MATRALGFDETSRTAKAGDISLHYNEAGDGPVLVMLHGGGPGASSWSNFKQNLPGLSERYRVLLVDQPGYGLSDKPKIDEPFWTYSARAVRDLLDTLGIDKAHFVGNSLGGGTTLRFALDYPERADRLVLMGPGGGAMSTLSPEPTEGIRLLMNYYAPPGPSREKMEAFIRIMLFDHSLVTEELIDERYAASIDPETMRGVQDALAGIAIRPEESELWRFLERIPHRTLLTWGRDDRVLPLDGAFFALKRMPDARLHVFPRCGHWAQLEHLEEFNWLTVNFLDQA